MTREELAGHDGKDGRAAYIAVNGTIYDISSSDLWKGGDHQGLHRAGHDLTEELKAAPHVKTVIERFPVVGKIEAAAVKKPITIAGIPLLSIIILAFVTLLMLATYMI